MARHGDTLLLPAALPDLANPSSVAFIAAIGTFVGGAVARGTFLGIGLAIYALANMVGSI
jgi:hypothetical protein